MTMLRIAGVCLAIAWSASMWCQVEPSAAGGSSTLGDVQMMTPPPVSGETYPVGVGSEDRSNYLAGGIFVSGAYNDNILQGGQSQKLSDASYSIAPTISLNRKTPLQGMSLSYSSGFMVYQKTSQLDSVTQNGTANYSYHLSRYAVASISDSFNQNNNPYNQPNPLAVSGVSAGTPPPTSVYVFPFQNQLGNSLNGGVQYQYGRNAMLGGGGNYSLVRFSQSSTANGLDALNDSNTSGGSAFWNRRLTPGQYVGVLYRYSRITTRPLQTTSATQTVLGYYTKYLNRTISFSVLGGPQHYYSQESTSPASVAAWTPAVQGSIGYQTLRTNIAANYSRMVSSAGGLGGVYFSNIASLQAQRKFARTFSAGATFSYAIFKTVTPGPATYNLGGHTVSGIVSLQRSYGEHFLVGVGYTRFHQSYSNFDTGSKLYPDSNREYASVSYQFTRPIGR